MLRVVLTATTVHQTPPHFALSRTRVTTPSLVAAKTRSENAPVNPLTGAYVAAATFVELAVYLLS